MQPKDHVPWWLGAVIYQVYPRSFCDTTGSGVGDLKGITSKLGYVRDLGVDAVWLSPFFRSPMKDFGYDVSDYRDVDPLFGTSADFDELVAEADRLGVAIIIDQVYSHSSDQHPWFQESIKSRNNPKSDWYVWADPDPAGAPPNNWQSIFGGPSWTWSSERQQYYLHNFLSSQPDLNLYNPEVEEEILDTARFWLDKGVKGFRLDALHCLIHSQGLKDNPPRPHEATDGLRPYNYQWHDHDHAQPETLLFLDRFRQLTDQYEATFTVAEVGADDALAVMKAYADEGRLQSAYSFEFLWTPKLSAELMRKSISAWPATGTSHWPSWAFSNHDAVRAVSRWEIGIPLAERARLFALFSISLRGNIFVYQGEELGLPQADVPFERLQDPEAISNWPYTLGRDGARTPMPWRAAEPYAGFSTAEPWLPVDGRYPPLAAEQQESDPGSTLNYFREVIGIRRRHPALRLGDLHLDADTGDVLMFDRHAQGQSVRALFNFSERTETRSVPVGAAVLAAAGEVRCDGGECTLPPWSGVLLETSGT